MSRKNTIKITLKGNDVQLTLKEIRPMANVFSYEGTWDWDTGITFPDTGPDDRYWVYNPAKNGGLLLIGGFRDEEDQTVRPQKMVRTYWTQFGLWGVKRNSVGEFSVAGDAGAGTYYQKKSDVPPLPDIPTPVQWAPVGFKNEVGPKGRGLPRMTVR